VRTSPAVAAGVHGEERLHPRRFVFIDEIWIKTKMASLRGWGGKGKRPCGGYAPRTAAGAR